MTRNTNQHASPAPWSVDLKTGDVRSFTYGWRSDAYRSTVCAIYGPDGEAWDAESETRANAHLVAAAPELADALDRYHRACAAYLPDHLRGPFSGVFAAAEAALKRATGAGRYTLPPIYSAEDESA